MGWIIDTLKDIPLNAVLREKLKDFEKRHEELEAEISKLKDENNKLIGENQELKSELKELTDTNELSADEEKILQLLSSNKDLTPDMIARRINLNLTKTEYYLERMCDEYISPAFFTSRPPQYNLTQKGREYLIKNNLIS